MKFRMNAEGTRFRKEMEKINAATANGEYTLKQLMEAVQTTRDLLCSSREELVNTQEEVKSLQEKQEHLTEQCRDLESYERMYRERANKYKNEADSALVLIALSGQKASEEVKQRVTEICQSAVELEKVREQLKLAESRLEFSP